MARTATHLLAAFTATACLIAAATAAASDQLPTLLAARCGSCHRDNDENASGVNLVPFIAATRTRDAELLQQMIAAIDRREMPPAGQPPFTAAERQAVLRDLRALQRDALAATATRAVPPIRRMTRLQYHNAVTDLFGLKVAVFTLPERIMRPYRESFQPETGVMADVVHVGNRPLGKSQMIEPRLAGVAAFPQDLRAEHGYDTQADHLSLSPLLMEAFLTLGQSITESPDFTPQHVGIWQTFFAEPEPTADIDAELRQRLRPLLTRAFRQPVDQATLDRYVAHARGRLAVGEAFTPVMKSLAAAVLASPRFLYLYNLSSGPATSTGGTQAGQGGEPVETAVSPADAPAAEQALADLALASRLSFFLWGSLPDEPLLSLASSGQLHQPEVLDAEIERMLADRRLKRFCDSFPAQWLQLDRLISSVPNREAFPQFYYLKYRDSMHMMLEPLLLFETVLIENRPITDLIDPDFTYRSAHLEEAYGELATPADRRPAGRTGEVAQLTFHRVPITDRRSGGVITNAAVMTMTSGPDRTKPITRGAWVASVIFNAPPPPPPADVPPLAENPVGDEAELTLRERLAMHRERSDCRGCHDRIDPFGFALENYDPVGGWRTQYENGRDVDASGVLFQTRPFTSPVELKDAVRLEKDRFTHAFAEHLLAFALARELTAADQPAIRRIARRTAKDGYRMQTLLREIVSSTPFRAPAGAPASSTASHKEHLP